MDRKIINHQINLDLIRQTQFGLTYQESNGVFFTELEPRENQRTTIYFKDKKVMEDFQECLKNPEIHFYSHSKVSIVTSTYKNRS